MIGRTIAHYKILEKLGEGGMGVVYKAQDTKLDRMVALKFLQMNTKLSPEEMARFEQEGKAISSLNHSNIATIHDIDEVEGKKFLVLEFIPGSTLKKKLKQLTTDGKRLSLDVVIDYGIQIAEGLGHAHREEIVHRDVKTDNIMLTKEGKLKITDFGLARLREGTDLTRTGSTLGTAAYMSPEQMQGSHVDGRSDLFSLGTVLYELTTSHLPFRGDHDAALAYSIVNEDPPPLKTHRADAPDSLQAVINKCLVKDASRRYQRAEEIVTDLKQIQHGTSASLSPIVVNRSKTPWLVAAGVVALAAAAIFYFLSPGRSTAENARTIAVLPFTNLSGNSEEEYFSDGITEDIITHLAKIGDLKVISRTSVMQFKGTTKTIREIGKTLNAGVVLEGSVRREGDQVRISAQLIDASTDEHLWAETYDKELTQVFAIQTEVAQKISNALEATLSHTERELIAKKPTVSTEAYTFYLKGRYNWNKRSSMAMPLALKNFQDAVAIDPNYALAWVGIADCYVTAFGVYLGIHAQEALVKGRDAVAKALAIDASLGEAYATLGAVRASEWEWEAAGKMYQRSVELNPGYATGHQWYGELLYLAGRPDEAIAEMKKAIDLDPISPIINSVLGWAYLGARRGEEAIAQAGRVLSAEPNFLDALDCKAQAMLLVGRPLPEFFPAQLARDSVGLPLSPEECRSLRGAFRTDGIQGFWKSRLSILVARKAKGSLDWEGYLVESYAQLGENKIALDYIGRMIERRDPILIYIRVWTYFEPLRKEPRFAEYVRALKFPS